MKKIVVSVALVISVGVLLTAACSPYETKDPTQARVIMLKDSKVHKSDDAARDSSVTAPETSLGEAPRSQP